MGQDPPPAVDEAGHVGTAVRAETRERLRERTGARDRIGEQDRVLERGTHALAAEREQGMCGVTDHHGVARAEVEGDLPVQRAPQVSRRRVSVSQEARYRLRHVTEQRGGEVQEAVPRRAERDAVAPPVELQETDRVAGAW